MGVFVAATADKCQCQSHFRKVQIEEKVFARRRFPFSIKCSFKSPLGSLTQVHFLGWALDYYFFMALLRGASF